MRVGGMVDVQSSTWPGINKHGGVGRIVKLHYVSSNKCVDDKSEVTHIDVKYFVMGGRERMVPVQYVNPAPECETTTTNTQVSAATTEKQRISEIDLFCWDDASFAALFDRTVALATG